MKTSTIQTYATGFLLFFISVVISYGFASLFSIPTEGDSLAYHIPIAQSILNFHVLHPDFYLGFYPGTAESILALLLLLHIPANVFNVFALVLLFFICKRLAIHFGLEKNYATIFAVTVCCLPTMLRWLSAQIIDIWLLVFYVWALSLLEKPKKTYRYFFSLGLSLGLLIGAKFSGPLFVAGLFLVYIRQIIHYVTRKSIIFFVIPFFLTGLIWYIRNAIIMHNPIYPQPIFSLPGKYDWTIFDYHEWQIIPTYPIKTFNAFLAEYLLWFLSPVVCLVWWIVERRKSPSSMRLAILGCINFLIFLFLPTTPEYNIIVSSIRYSYPCFVIFILLVFLLAQLYKRQELLLLLSFSGLLFLPQLSYRPKLLIVYLVTIGGFLLVKKAIIRR